MLKSPDSYTSKLSFYVVVSRPGLEINTTYQQVPQTRDVKYVLPNQSALSLLLILKVSDNLKMQGNIYQDCKDNMNCEKPEHHPLSVRLWTH